MGFMMQAAGVEDEPEVAARQAPKQEDWVKQHIRSSGKQAAEPPRRTTSDRADRHTMVSIVGYDDSSSASAARPSKTYPNDTAGYGSLGYGNIAGAFPSLLACSKFAFRAFLIGQRLLDACPQHILRSGSPWT